MAGQEERILRELKRLQKRRVTKRNRRTVRQRLDEANYEAAAQDDAVSQRELVKHMRIGQNKPRDGHVGQTS